MTIPGKGLRTFPHFLLTVTILVLQLIALVASFWIGPMGWLLFAVCLLTVTVCFELAFGTFRWTFSDSHLQLDPDGLRAAFGGAEHHFRWCEIERMGWVSGIPFQTLGFQLRREMPAMRLTAGQFLFRKSKTFFALPPLWRKRDLRIVEDFHNRYANHGLNSQGPHH